MGQSRFRRHCSFIFHSSGTLACVIYFLANGLFPSGFSEIPHEATLEAWEEMQLSTIELSIMTQNRQLDLTVRAQSK